MTGLVAWVKENLGFLDRDQFIKEQEEYDKRYWKVRREHWESLDNKNMGELWGLETKYREKEKLGAWTDVIAKIVRKLNDGD